MNTSDNLPQHIARFEQNMDAALSRPNNDTEAPQSEWVDAETLASANPTAMVRDVEKRIESLQRSLAETRGYDPMTGKPALALPEGHARRRSFEMQLHQLTTQTLPYTRQRAAYIAELQAQRPTMEDRLRSQLAEQQRIQAAARAKAEENKINSLVPRMAAYRGGSR